MYKKNYSTYVVWSKSIDCKQQNKMYQQCRFVHIVWPRFNSVISEFSDCGNDISNIQLAASYSVVTTLQHIFLEASTVYLV